MNRTKIEWTDFTANPVRYRTADGRVVWACEKVSPGCKHCYAEALSVRYPQRRAGEWNAATMKTLTPFLDEKELRTLLTSTTLTGKRVFIGDMTDVFGAWVPDELLDRLFAVFALRPDVTFQVLTKRPERMARYLAAIEPGSARNLAIRQSTSSYLSFVADKASVIRFPLLNVWLGFSAEDQERFDERWPHVAKLAATGWTTFCSAEPLLGPIKFSVQPMHEFPAQAGEQTPIANGDEYDDWKYWAARDRGLKWVIVGGESGSGARPCDVAWIRSIVEQCQAAGVPVFVKQLGSRPQSLDDARWRHHALQGHEERLYINGRMVASIFDQAGGGITWFTWFDGGLAGGENGIEADQATARGEAVRAVVRQGLHSVALKSRKGSDPDAWPADLRVRQFPEVR